MSHRELNTEKRETSVQNDDCSGLIRKIYSHIDAFFPCRATLSGEHAFDGLLESYSQSRRLAFSDTLLALSRELSSAPFASCEIQVKVELILALREILKEHYKLNIECDWERDPGCYLLPFASSIYYLMERDFAPREERHRAVLERIEGYGAFLDEARGNLRHPSLHHLTHTIPVSLGVKLYLESVLQRISRELPEAAAMAEKLYTSIQRALKAFKDHLTNLLPEAEAHPDNLRSSLVDQIRNESLVSLRENELWDLAQEFLSMAEENLRKTSSIISEGSSWQTLVRQAAFNHPSTGSLKNAYAQSIDSSREFTRAYVIEIAANETVPIMETPYFIRFKYPTVSYAAAGGLEAGQSTFFCLTPIVTGFSRAEEIEQLKEHCFGRIEYIPIHEVYPGHHCHFQHASRNPSYAIRRTRSAFTAEGWAIYSEDLARDLGYFSPDGLLSLMEAQLWRSARLWLEMGLHLQKIDLEGARTFLLERICAPEAVVEAEIRRSLANPCEASAYCLGWLELQELKEDFQKKHPQAALPEFHRQFLESGCIPVRLISSLLGLRESHELDGLWKSLHSQLKSDTSQA
jgi:hypothetical protein